MVRISAFVADYLFWADVHTAGGAAAGDICKIIGSNWVLSKTVSIAARASCFAYPTHSLSLLIGHRYNLSLISHPVAISKVW